MQVTRRKLIIAGGVAITGGPLNAVAQTQSSVPERPPALAPALVNQFVVKAHSDLAATKMMLTDQPLLLNATWDWGGGDFETGIGGAGHMGNREIAEFLIGKGARLDVFVAAMLGKVDIVRALLTAWPPVASIERTPWHLPCSTCARRR